MVRKKEEATKMSKWINKVWVKSYIKMISARGITTREF